MCDVDDVVTYVDVIFGRFITELQDAVLEENQSFILGFVSATKPPDLIHILRNGTARKLIVIRQPTAEANSDKTCNYSVVEKNGFNVTMSCTAALPQHSGTYIGTDNDDSETAQKTFAHVIVVEGMKRVSGVGTNYGVGVEEVRPERPRAGDGVLGEGTASHSPPTRGFAGAL